MKRGFYAAGLEAYPWPFVIGQNAVYLAQFGLGAALLWPLSPALAALYLGLLVYLLGFFLRRHLCTHCFYYGRRCGTGWGLLAARLYPRGSGNYALGVRAAGIIWGFAYLLPLLAGVYLLFAAFTPVRLGLFLAFLLVGGLGVGWHRASCVRCKMRCRCPASMARC